MRTVGKHVVDGCPVESVQPGVKGVGDDAAGSEEGDKGAQFLEGRVARKRDELGRNLRYPKCIYACKSHEIVHLLPAFQSCLRLSDVQLPRLGTHIDRVDVYDAFAHAADGVVSFRRVSCTLVIVDRHVFASVEALAGMEACGGWILRDDGAQEGVRDVRVDGVLIPVDMNLYIL